MSEKKEELEATKRSGELKSKVPQLRAQEKLREQDFHYSAKEFFEPTTKSVTEEELFKESKDTRKTFEALDQNKKPVLRPIFLIPFDQMWISSDIVADLIEIMAKIKKVDWPLYSTRNQEWIIFKAITTVPFKIETKIKFFLKNAFIGFSSEGKLLSLILKSDSEERRSKVGETLHNFPQDIQKYASRRYEPTTSDATIKERYLFNECPNPTVFLPESPDELHDRLRTKLQKRKVGMIVLDLMMRLLPFLVYF